MEIGYRGATLDDLNALLPLVQGFARERAAGAGQTLSESFADTAAGMLENALRHPAAFLVVAEADGKPVGYVSAAIQEPPPIFSGEPYLFVSDLYVLPERRGQGIGSALVERVKGFAFLRGMPRLSIVVPVRSAAARRVVEKVGFEQVEGLFYWAAQP